MYFKATPRQGVITKRNRVLVSVDFSSQEIAVAAVLSNDQLMLDTFRQPAVKVDQEGNKYTNPFSDLHTISAKNCIAPELFVGQPESKWVKIAKESRLKGKKQTIRDSARFWPFLK